MSINFLSIIDQGVDYWNFWRTKNPLCNPEINNIDLSGKALIGINFSNCFFNNTDLSRANLTSSDFSGAKFISDNKINSACFKNAKLKGIDFSQMKLGSAEYLINNQLKRICTVFIGADLFDANFRGAELIDANFCKADLQNAKLNNSILSGVIFEDAKMYDAEIDGAVMDNVKLSGCTISMKTLKFNKITGCSKGINGIFCEQTNSAALAIEVPLGNSMEGASSESVIDLLKQSRKTLTSSILISVLGIRVVTLNINEIKVPYFSDIKASPIQFESIGIFISACLLYLSESFLNSAINLTRYIHDREGAIKIAHFPWVLSKFEKTFFRRILSFIVRILLCFHPIAYIAMHFFENGKCYIQRFPLALSTTVSGLTYNYFIYFIDIDLTNNHSINNNSSFIQKLIEMTSTIPTIIIIFYIVIFLFGTRIFILSQNFQKPILFDSQTENMKISDLGAIAEELSKIAFFIKRR